MYEQIFTKDFVKVVFLSGLVTIFVSGQKYDCSKAAYTRCVNLADPLLREPHLIFPDNMDDIDIVCRTWNNFVKCLGEYTDNCFDERQKKQFNKAVENPIDSVHQMCTQSPYQKEYLRYASCIKSTVTEISHCGPQYALLVEQVSKGDAIAKASLCCSHHRFKQCVMRETQTQCDGNIPNGNAARFSAQIIDKALSFLQDQCYNYIPNSGDCPMTTATMDQIYTSTILNNDVRTWRLDNNQNVDPSYGLPTSGTYNPSGGSYNPSYGSYGSGLSGGSNNFNNKNNGNGRETSTGTSGFAYAQDGSNMSQDRHNEQGRHMNRDRDMMTTNKESYNPSTLGAMDPMRAEHSTEVSWLPAISPVLNNNVLQSGRDPTQISIIPSGRTRPSSYGRSSSWMPSTPGESSSMKPDWVTAANWHNFGHDTLNKAGDTLSTTWFPAAGSYAGNAIDEPNQQGLKRPPSNSAVKSVVTATKYFIIKLTMSLFIIFLVVR